MASTNPRDWIFQGWFAWRLPWVLDHKAFSRLGDGLLEQFAEFRDAVCEETQQSLSLRHRREGLLHMDVTLASHYISFSRFQLNRVDEWKPFNTGVVRLLGEHTDLFDAKFNLLQGRQSILVTIRDVSDPGKALFKLLGKEEFIQGMAGKEACEEIGIDQEFVFPAPEAIPMRLILRFQTHGPTASWMPSNEIWLTPSVVLDSLPEAMDDIYRHWEAAQEKLLSWVGDTVHPNLIERLIRETG